MSEPGNAPKRASRPRPLEILALNCERQPRSLGQRETYRPNFEVNLVDLARLGRLALVMRIIREAFGGSQRIQFALRDSQPALRDRGFRFGRSRRKPLRRCPYLACSMKRRALPSLDRRSRRPAPSVLLRTLRPRSALGRLHWSSCGVGRGRVSCSRHQGRNGSTASPERAMRRCVRPEGQRNSLIDCVTRNTTSEKTITVPMLSVIESAKQLPNIGADL